VGKALKSYADWRLQESMIEYNFYNRRFKRLLETMFTWNKLPDGIPERYIEQSLYETGLIIFYKSAIGYVVTRATPIGLNLYNEPTGYRAYGANGLLNEFVKAKDCVPIWNDYSREGNIQNVHFFAKRISNIEKTIDINLENLKQPIMVTCSENQRDSVKTVMGMRSNGDPLIFVDEEFHNMNGIKVWDMHATNNVPTLEDTKRDLINEALTFFGIKNVPVKKKERMITSEANQAEEQVFLNSNVMYRPRQLAVEAINTKFDLDIELAFSQDIDDNIKALGVDNG
jgi:hypothetical protein